jgi:L-threonylcarbamoyladenylate synthase
MHKDIEKSVKTLKAGGIILYPTDTIWGLGCDATNAEAVNKIYNIKKRKDARSLLILVNTEDIIKQYVDQISDIPLELMEKTKTSLTIVYPGAKNLPPNLIHSDGSIGIRVTRDKFCSALITRIGKPIVATSANISDKPYPRNFSEIEKTIKQSVDYIVKWRQVETRHSEPSKIIKLKPDGSFKIVRE